MQFKTWLESTQTLQGYKIVGWHPVKQQAFSIYDRSPINIKIGSVEQGRNFYLGTTRQFCTDYYRGLTMFQDLLLTYEYSPEDIVGPDKNPPPNSEVIVRKAVLKNVEYLPYQPQ